MNHLVIVSFSISVSLCGLLKDQITSRGDKYIYGILWDENNTDICLECTEVYLEGSFEKEKSIWESSTLRDYVTGKRVLGDKRS